MHALRRLRHGSSHDNRAGLTLLSGNHHDMRQFEEPANVTSSTRLIALLEDGFNARNVSAIADLCDLPCVFFSDHQTQIATSRSELETLVRQGCEDLTVHAVAPLKFSILSEQASGNMITIVRYAISLKDSADGFPPHSETLLLREGVSGLRIISIVGMRLTPTSRLKSQIKDLRS